MYAIKEETAAVKVNSVNKLGEREFKWSVNRNCSSIMDSAQSHSGWKHFHEADIEDFIKGWKGRDVLVSKGYYSVMDPILAICTQYTPLPLYVPPSPTISC